MIYLLILAIIGILILGMMLIDARDRVTMLKEILEGKNDRIGELNRLHQVQVGQIGELCRKQIMHCGEIVALRRERDKILVEIWGDDPPERNADDVVKFIRALRAVAALSERR